MSDPQLTTDLSDLIGPTTPVRRHRRDPLKGLLLCSSICLACLAGIAALLTHRDWIRWVDIAVEVLAVCEVARLLVTRSLD